MVERQFVALKVVGSNPASHPLVLISTVTFFQKKKIKKKILKKKHHLIKTITYTSMLGGLSILKNLSNYNFYKKKNIENLNTKNKVGANKNTASPINIILTQKKNNPKALLSINDKNANTFSVGSVVKYFKVKQGKYIRRSSKGLKIFLNFIRSIFLKKYIPKRIKYMVFSISGFDYNLIFCKKNIKYFLQRELLNQVFFLYNLRVSFTKKKEKKIKSIKKRLKKKILKNFLKKVNIN